MSFDKCFHLLISTTSKMRNVAMTTNDFLVHYPNRLPLPLFPGNRWPALRLYRSGWPSLDLNTDVKMGLVSFAQHDGLRFIHDVEYIRLCSFSFFQWNFVMSIQFVICLFTDIYIVSQFPACVNKAPINIHRQIFVWTYVYVLCGWIPRIKIIESHCKHMFNFVKKLPNCYSKGLYHLYFL